MRPIFFIMCAVLLSRGSETTKQDRLQNGQLEYDSVINTNKEPNCAGSDKSEENEMIESMSKDKKQILENVYKSALLRVMSVDTCTCACCLLLDENKSGVVSILCKEPSIRELDEKYKERLLTDEKIVKLEKETIEGKKNGDIASGSTGYTQIIPSSDGSENFYVRKLSHNVKNAKKKDEKIQKLRHEKEMYLKMKNIKGVVKFHQNL
jgi:hypothetical protein